MVVNRLARNGVVAVALGLRPQRADHLRVTAIAAFADVDIPALQLERVQGLYARRRMSDLTREIQRNDLDQATHADNDRDQNAHEARASFDDLVLHIHFLSWHITRVAERPRRRRSRAPREWSCARCRP